MDVRKTWVDVSTVEKCSYEHSSWQCFCFCFWVSKVKDHKIEARWGYSLVEDNCNNLTAAKVAETSIMPAILWVFCTKKYLGRSQPHLLFILRSRLGRQSQKNQETCEHSSAVVPKCNGRWRACAQCFKLSWNLCFCKKRVSIWWISLVQLLFRPTLPISSREFPQKDFSVNSC